MWAHGIITVNEKTMVYAIKHFDKASDYGINGGRISKIMIQQNDAVLYSYDRGEDLAPRNDEARKALEQLIERYN